MNSIFKKPKVTNSNSGRNGFDCSFSRSFTSPLGALLPVAHDLANAGDKYKLNTTSFIRTEAIDTAAFCQLKLHVDWFFVPMVQIYSRWNEFFNQVDDVMSSIFISDTSTPYNYDLPTFQVFPDVAKGSLATKFYQTDQPGTTIYYNADVFGIPYYWNFRRLWDMLDYGSLSALFGGNTDKASFSLLPFFAYHKIFHSHYLLTDWFKNDPKLFNIDAYIDPNRSNKIDVLFKVLSTLHYRPYRRDFFTNLMPSPMWSESYANYINGSFDNINLRNQLNPELGKISDDYPVNVFSKQGSSQQGASVSAATSGSFSTPLYELTTADLRSMYALDKLLRVTAFSKSHYADQVLAHFGYKMPEGISDEAYFLGSQTTDIKINEVVATASTGSSGAGSVLGDIAGKAFGLTNGAEDINFTCPCDGIIMAVSSIEPIPRYSSRFVNRQNLYKQTYDFYHPEFDNVGMQPLTTNPYQVNYNANAANSLQGWQYRYSEYKTKVDIVNEGFWATHRASWTPTKQDMFDLHQMNVVEGKVLPSLEANFYIFPQYCNTMFLQQVPFYVSYDSTVDFPSEYLCSDTYSQPPVSVNPNFTPLFNGDKVQPNNVYQYDNFMVDMSIKMFKTSIMSVHSLPKIL